MDAILIALPELLFSSIIALPLVLGVIAVIRHLRAGSRFAYLQNLAATVAAGAVMLPLLWSSLFGDSLLRSSTASLILAVAPIDAAIAQGLVYGIVAPLFKKSAMPRTIPLLERVAVLIPLLMLAILTAGLANIAVKDSDTAFAEKTSNPQTLHRLLEKSRTGEADSFAVPFHLAQNPNAPVDILSELAKSEHATVRAHVASNPGTPLPVVAALRYDCAPFVRKIVVERLGPGNAIEPPPAPTGVCPKHWR